MDEHMLEQAVAKAVALSGEYLFFFGAAYIALLLAARRRWIAAALTLGLGVLWITFHLPVTLYLESLGSDSFAEVGNIDLHEARFWLTTLGEAIHPQFSWRKFLAYSVAVAVSFYALRLLMARMAGPHSRRYVVAKTAFALLFMAVALHRTASTAVASYVENSELYETTIRNFSNEAPALAAGPARLDLVVYIGESTSTMNMGVYGYPRQTTPELARLAARDEGLLLFHHVFSTHAHTSRSLLEALSFGLDEREQFLPIARRQRVSVVDVLKEAGVSTRLVSNQGLGGSWDHASSIIFRQSENVFRVKAVAAGEPLSRWDHELFEEQLARQAAGVPPRVTFLHSYAGHGTYAENIPPRFRTPVDDALAGLRPEAVSEDPRQRVAEIEDYDAAVRYVDFSVGRVIGHLQASARPTVLVYFADHGDSVFTGRGHDSARFRHEMARVPFVLYFNEAARRAAPELVARYRARAAAREVATLAQLPATLLDLLDLRPAGPQRRGFLLPPVVGEPTVHPPVMVRDAAEGISYVNLNAHPLPGTSPLGHKLIDRTDPDTRVFVALHAGALDASRVCGTPPRSFEAVSRAILLAGCPHGMGHMATFVSHLR